MLVRQPCLGPYCASPLGVQMMGMTMGHNACCLPMNAQALGWPFKASPTWPLLASPAPQQSSHRTHPTRPAVSRTLPPLPGDPALGDPLPGKPILLPALFLFPRST